MNDHLTKEELDNLYTLAHDKRIPLPRWFARFDHATDCPDHQDSGLAAVDTGRSSDWPIARLCEWPTAEYIAAANPLMISRLIQQVRDYKEQRDELSEIIEKCHAMLDRIEGAEEGTTSVDPLDTRLEEYLWLKGRITDDDVNGDD